MGLLQRSKNIVELRAQQCNQIAPGRNKDGFIRIIKQLAELFLGIVPLAGRDIGKIPPAQLCEILFHRAAKFNFDIVFQVIIIIFSQGYPDRDILFIGVFHLHIQRHDPGGPKKLQEFVLQALFQDHGPGSVIPVRYCLRASLHDNIQNILFDRPEKIDGFCNGAFSAGLRASQNGEVVQVQITFLNRTNMI